MNAKLTLGLLSLLVGLNACSRQSNNQTHPQNSLRIDLVADINTTDPQKVNDQYAYRVLNDSFEGLLDLNQSNQPIPGMAIEWKVSADKLVYTFNLRHDLKFSDGSPIRAKDFVYSWQRLVDPNTAAAYAFILQNLQNAPAIMTGKATPNQLGIKALDDYTLEVNLSQADPAFLNKAALIVTTALESAVINKFADQWSDPKHIVTTGAYKLDSRIVNGTIKALKNPYYYNAPEVKIAQVEYSAHTDRNSALAAYETGSLDITANVPIDQYNSIKANFGKQLNTVQNEGFAYYSINTQLAKFKDVRVRQALSMVVDRKILANNILAAGQFPMYSYVTPTLEDGEYGSIIYDWTNQPYTEQVTAAQQLYAAAGYSEKHPLEVTLSYSNNDESKKVALAIAAMWSKALGVKVTVANYEWKVFINNRKNGAFEIARNSWGADYNFITTYTPLYSCNTGENVSRLCLPLVDKLFAHAALENNSELQQQEYAQGLKLAMEQYGIIPLYQNSYTTLVKPYVDGLDLHTNSLNLVQSKWISFK
ncbi:MAG: peptide ABC transporter substrate-binding protein [Burkholderiales bacterium]|jgi:oligopeptide transport system substrate-binding protein|nr:peptide ABC transporter substrate-binding protein [Burkholderiales bacterium]MBP9768772.1 peptide ABC transporter substrate-binding protein [Burkholderiales bacterium]